MNKLNLVTSLILFITITSCSFKKKEEDDRKNSNSSSTSNTKTGIQFKTLQGVIDTSFGLNGLVLHDNAAFGGAGGFDSGDSINITSDGKIIICGISNNGTNHDLAIWKYNQFGLLDEDFGSGGIVLRHNIAGGNNSEYCRDFIVNNDDSFFLTGNSMNGINTEMILMRYKKNGANNYNFGVGGFITHDGLENGSGDDYGEKILKTSEDALLVFGSSEIAFDTHSVIWKYFNNGSRDTTFGSDGIFDVTSTYSLSTGSIRDAFVLKDYKTVILGYHSNGGNKGYLARISSNGLTDPTFGTGGLIEFNDDIGSSKSICHATNDFVIYTSYTGGENNSKVYKVVSNGSLDTSFGSNGIVILQDNFDTVKCLKNALDELYILARHNGVIKIYKMSEDGILDNSFGDGGIFSYGSSGYSPYDMKFAKDGSLLISGFYSAPENQMFIIKVD